jgi:hypothetical protein
MRRLLCKYLRSNQRVSLMDMKHLNNHDLHVAERRQLPNLCRKCAGQLIGGQEPAKKHVNLNGHETQPGTISQRTNSGAPSTAQFVSELCH